MLTRLSVIPGKDQIQYKYNCARIDPAGKLHWEAAAAQKERLAYPEVRKNEVHSYCRDIFDSIREGARGEGNVHKVRELGRVLYGLLMPNGIAQRLSQMAPGDDLVLEIDEDLIAIPWELLSIGNDFFCTRFRISRSPAIEYGPQQRVPPTGSRILLLTDPEENLPSAAKEGTILLELLRRSGKLKADYESGKNISRYFVKAHLPACYILHYSGHSTYSGWQLADGMLTAEDVEDFRKDPSVPFPQIIFSNSCSSAQTKDWEDHGRNLYGLVQAFLRGGIQCYIGSFTKVLDDRATEFAYRFYTGLLEGGTVGEAMRQARCDTLEADLTWASYVLYGDPSFTLAPETRDDHVHDPKTIKSREQSQPRIVHELMRPLRAGIVDGPPLDHKSEDLSIIPPPKPKLFKGRKVELGRLTDYLTNDNISIVVIEGISGIGKTALAARFAASVDKVKYKTFWLDCHQETTLDFITLQLARFARNNGDHAAADLLEDIGGRFDDRIAKISTALAQLNYALFFDDYQYIIDPKVDRFLEAIEERGGKTKIFLTTRRRPRILGLGRPVGIAEEFLQKGLDIESCGRFLRECGVTISKTSVRKIWKLSGEGHPKALQLIVARSRGIPIPELLSSLPIFREDVKQEWLMPFLNEIPQLERDIIVDLSVFDRPFNLSALRRLYPEKAMDPLVVSLVDRFLLEFGQRDSLQMHPLVRDFCYSLLTDREQKHRWAGEFYFEDCKKATEPDMVTDAEIESGFAAWSHFVKGGDHSRATSVIRILKGPLINRGHYDRVMLLLENTTPPTVEVDWFSIMKGRILALRGLHEEAIGLITPLIESPYGGVQREAILSLTDIYNEQNKARESIEILDANWHLFVGLQRDTVRFLRRVVQAHLLLGDAEQALGWANRIVQACDARDDKIGGAIALRQVALSLHAKNKMDLALPMCKLSYDILKEQKRVREATLSQMEMGLIQEDLGQYQTAKSSLEDALQELTKMGDRKNSVICRQRLNNLRNKWQQPS